MAVTKPRERPAVTDFPAARGVPGLLVSMRPSQWVKNLVVPLPFLFGGALAAARGWWLAAAGFGVFCAVTSAIYLVNDVMDRERDRAHPVKRRRPLAAGDLSVRTAIAAAAVLGIGGLAAAFALSESFGVWCAIYAGLMLAYSLLLKGIPFLEALIVAAGLPLRALAGAALAGLAASSFLMGCAYLLALFLVIGKRQWELQNAGNLSSSEHRPVLAAYRREGLDFLFVVTALTTVAAYAAYSVVPSTIRMHGGRSLAATVPFVVLGVARYVRLVYSRGGGGNPTRALLIDDPWILLIVLGWVAAAGWIIYVR
ncbi:MAG TPA: UbiA prenyltransferase family protein [Thermoanaerobaculia bacterium]|nr:UbiA prenyltransferase family protein [Thermoanaerobaculia bacterium]